MGARTLSSCIGKTALVTEAAYGTGRAAAIALARAGAQVLVHHHRKTARAEAVVEAICAAGGKARAIAADILAAEGPHELARRTREIVGERLDVLVVNAGTTRRTAIEDATVEGLDSKLAAEIRAPFSLIQQLLPILNRGSSIIFTSPPATRTAPDTAPKYASTSGAIANLVNHFAPLLSPRGIRVNAIAPIAARSHDIGAAIAFLASNDACRITGETLQLEEGDLR
jgi:NAD(P)-dependent dehydrogenase (short-subunit alcohol dehydrogenase family)